MPECMAMKPVQTNPVDCRDCIHILFTRFYKYISISFQRLFFNQAFFAGTPTKLHFMMFFLLHIGIATDWNLKIQEVSYIALVSKTKRQKTRQIPERLTKVSKAHKVCKTKLAHILTRCIQKWDLKKRETKITRNICQKWFAPVLELLKSTQQTRALWRGNPIVHRMFTMFGGSFHVTLGLF